MNNVLRIQNIGELVLVPRGPVLGRSMGQIRRLAHAEVLIEGDRIAWFGPATAYSGANNVATFDARGGCVVPGLVDAHTHTVFAGTREHEFVARIQGKTYTQIAQEGGGIVVTVEAVRRASEDELLELALPRLERMLRHGVTTVEIKSGYGLSVKDEIKMLRVIRRARELQPVSLIGTYLAAHTTAREFAGRADAYLDQVLADAVFQRIRDESLAEFCDVFCESGAFNVVQAQRVLAAGARFGLRGKVHADQINQIGASALAAKMGAVSADHLEKIDAAGIAAMKSAGTVAVLLPGSSFFLGVHQAPARTLLDADLPVALATDFNPGSSMIESLPLVMSIACTQMRMTPVEALVAATANGAAALGRHAEIGAIEVGMKADLVVLDVPNVDRWMYEVGRDCVRAVIKSGRVVVERGPASAAGCSRLQ